MLPLIQGAGPQALIRPVTLDDRPELEELINRDPIAFLYAAEHLEFFGLPASSALSNYRSAHGFMGIFVSQQESQASAVTALARLPRAGDIKRRLRSAAQAFVSPLSQRGASSLTTGLKAGAAIPGQSEALSVLAQGTADFRMVGAFWLGANCVPIHIPPEYRRQVASVVAKASRNLASIFGVAQDVLGLWEVLRHRVATPFSVRENQPLLYLPPERELKAFSQQPLYRAGLPLTSLASKGVRWARPADRPSLIKASVAMFIEEVGYDPLERDPAGYTGRIDEFIKTGRSLVACNRDGTVVFKVDIGLANGQYCQVQGVWLHPSYRGRGISKVLLAQAFELIRSRHRHISLYVNDYNRRACGLYTGLGLEQRGKFASILF